MLAGVLAVAIMSLMEHQALLVLLVPAAIAAGACSSFTGAPVELPLHVLNLLILQDIHSPARLNTLCC